MQKTAFRLKAFTLIELLIVVAIIAILAAIAVPNFLEAQTRSKVSRAKADIRTLATGLESYYVDNNSYPKSNFFGTSVYSSGGSGGADYETAIVLERLSTPIAYVTNGLLPDPFLTKARSGSISSSDGSFSPTPMPADQDIKFFKYHTPGPTGLQDVGTPEDRAKWYYILQSNGPSLTYLNLGGLLSSSATEEAVANNVYDPTNGTVSHGGIFRIGGSPTGEGEYGNTFFRTIKSVQD